jgi:hypothetical protein
MHRTLIMSGFSFIARLMAATTVMFSLSQSLNAAGVGQSSLTAVHDTYIQRGTTTNFGAATTFLVKRDGADFSGGSDRIAYLRFDVDAPQAGVDGASLWLTFTNYPGDGITPFTFQVFGLPDGHANESFDESALNFSNATNASTTLPGSLNLATGCGISSRRMRTTTSASSFFASLPTSPSQVFLLPVKTPISDSGRRW